MKYIFFDLDETLCESKQKCSSEMLTELKRLSKKYQIIIVSGGEFSRVFLQCPLPNGFYMPQNGNEFYIGITRIRKNNFHSRNLIRKHAESLAKEMKMTIGEDMFEDRGSQISFSFIGHNAPLEIKKKFDPERKIRMGLLDKLPFKRAVIGGTTCIDYVPRTKGENIYHYLKNKNIPREECLYIGDSFCKYGNDETVRGVIPIKEVKNPLETFKFLKTL